ncbi:STAS domain-containing protein [Nonomuraea sp. NPDC051191]|uniref:STAS domain-containing protein n=1 Tax=Nonomuraea sp. NPDC051191 TaxID=3364372 RepID=UPI00378D0ABF
MSPLEISRRLLPAAVLITLSGELDATNIDHLESAVGRAYQAGRPLILDLGELTFLDSRGLHLLLRVHRDVRSQDGTVHVAGVHGAPARTLQLTGVWDTLNIHTAVEDAIRATQNTLRPRS